MSYILDALKKSEKERQRGAVPNLMTPHDNLPQRPKKRLLWPYVLIAVLLLNAGLLLWFFSHKAKKPDIAIQPTAAKAFRPAEPAKNAAPNAVQVGDNPIPQTATVVRKNQSVQPQPQDAAQKNAHSLAPAAPKQTQKVNTSDIQSSAGTIAATEQKTLRLSELPSAIRQNLPPFNISVHLYAGDPASRKVRINGQMLQEGEDLSPGVKLEKITPDGAIFSYQKYRFQIELNR